MNNWRNIWGFCVLESFKLIISIVAPFYRVAPMPPNPRQPLSATRTRRFPRSKPITTSWEWIGPLTSRHEATNHKTYMFQKYSNLVSSGTLWEFPAPSFMIGRCVKSTQLPSYTWTETWLPLLNSLLTFTDWHNLRDSWCMSPEWQISEDSDLRIIVSCMFCHIQNDHEVMDTYYGDTKRRKWNIS